MGLLQAIELVEDRESKKPAAAATNALLEAARENRVMFGKGGTYGNVIRISPPMNIAKSDVDEFALRMDASLKQRGNRMAGAASLN
jgi:4-aminobutyrate aminotransferase